MKKTAYIVAIAVLGVGLLVCVGLLTSSYAQLSDKQALLNAANEQIEQANSRLSETDDAEGGNAQSSEDSSSVNFERLYRKVGDDINDMCNTMSKLEVAASPDRTLLLLADLWRLSGSASAALSELPEAHGNVGKLTSFITRAGDYAYALMQGVLNDRPLSADDTEQLSKMKEYCIKVSESIESRLESGQLPTDFLDADGFYCETNESEGLSDIPTLIYDGPYSETNELLEPLADLGGEVSQDEALNRAKELFPDYEASYESLCNGRIPTHDIALSGEKGEISLSLTKMGGLPLYFMGSPVGNRNDAPNDEETKRLHEAAQTFLSEWGYGELHPSYAQYYEGSVVINYAAVQDGVVLYSDLIKVYVDRESFEVFGMDASGYCFCHRQRELNAPSLSQEEAQERLSLLIEVESVTLTLIPKTRSTEVLCWEFKGKKGNDSYIVYINAETGAEEEIFLVINSEESDLVV